MPTCIECGSSVSSLYTEYSKGNIRLTQCAECHQFADRYVEHDAVLIFIDMMLHKPQVYRHLLFNRQIFQEGETSASTIKLTILLILFDVYIKWFRFEKMDIEEQPNFFYNQAFYVQYICILLMSVLEFLSFYFGVQFAFWWLFAESRRFQRIPSAFSPLVVSSFGKLLTILIVIWNYSEAHYSWMLNVLVFTSNAEALSVYFRLSYWSASLLVVIGHLTKWLSTAVYYLLMDGLTASPAYDPLGEDMSFEE